MPSAFRRSCGRTVPCPVLVAASDKPKQYMHIYAHQFNSCKTCTGPCQVPFEDLVDAQAHAQCLLQQAINLNSARTHAYQVNSVKRCTGPFPEPFEDLVDAQGHAQCWLQNAINLKNAHTCTSGK
jgi:hypothetical protein